jgi:hypothetical protein
MASSGTTTLLPSRKSQRPAPAASFWNAPFSRPTARCLAWMERSDWFCFSVLLLIRAIFRPYVGLVHDAKLYALQVANRATDGFFNEDLFFAFGSQDSFSAVSNLLSPIVHVMGLQNTFIAAYIFSMGLLIYAEFRLVKLLIGHAGLAVLVTAFVVAFDHPYGGRSVFHVHEPFFTARLLAEALVMLGLTMLWQVDGVRGSRCVGESNGRRSLAAIALSIVATFIHPLMGIGGLAVVAGIFLSRWVHIRILLVGVGILTCTILVLGAWGPTIVPASIARISGEWEASARVVSPHCYISEWFKEDLVQNSAIIGVLIAGAILGTGLLRQISIWTAVLGIGSMAVSWLADRTGIAILIAGQAYRGLWLPTLIVIPVAYFLIQRLISFQRVYLTQFALVLLSAIMARTACLDRWQTVAAIYLFLNLMKVITEKFIARPRADMLGWLHLKGEQRPQVFVLTLWFLATVSVLTLRNTAELFQRMPIDPLSATWIAFRFASPILLAITGIVIAAHVVSLTGRRLAIVTFLFFWITINAGVGILLKTPAYRDQFHPELQSLNFIKSCIGSTTPRAQTVYWPFHSLDTWIELNANAYHEFTQVSGIVFSKEMAQESQRRCQLIAKFEVAAMPMYVDLPRYWDCVLRYMKIDSPMSPPDHQDLANLARDRQLDWIVLPYPISGVPVASDGRVFIYNCREIEGTVREISRRDGKSPRNPNAAAVRPPDNSLTSGA